MSNYKETHEETLSLFANAPKVGRFLDHTRNFIEEGEYGLALDDICSLYMRADQKMSPTDLEIFSRLVSEMELQQDPEYDAIRRFFIYCAIKKAK